jgi:hypothetical protein
MRRIAQASFIPMASLAHHARWIDVEAAMAAITFNAAGILPAEPRATVSAQFQPLDPGLVSAGIPAFFIGRNKEGFWVARDVNGQIGGIFLLENSAVSFARRNSEPAGCVTIFPSETIELDLENKGNPMVGQLGSLTRLATRAWRQTATLASKMMRTAGRRVKDL